MQRARRAVVASMDPMQRAARHAMRMAGTTALQDLLAEVAASAGDGGCTDDACKESHAAARGEVGIAARASTRRRGGTIGLR